MAWDVRRVAVLRAIAEHRSFTRAAEALLMTQPAVSRQLAALERELGTELVMRGPRHVALTPAGAELLEAAEGLMPAIEAVERRVRGAQDPEGGAVRIGAVPSALAGFVADALAALRERRPRLEATIEEGWSAALAREIARGDLDIAVISEAACPSGMSAMRLATEPFVALVPQGHSLSGRTRVRLTALAAERWLVAPEPAGRAAVVEACRAAGFTPRISGAATWDAAAPLVAAGLGVALAPRATGTRLARGAAIETLALERAPMHALALIRAARNGPTPVEDDLIEALLAAAPR